MLIRKILYIIPFLFLLLFPINAGELKGIGTGATESEAITEARKDLISSIGISVTYTQVTSRSTGGEGKEQMESFSSQSIQSASFDLLGVVEETQKEGKTYTATVTIPSSSARLYIAKAHELHSDIERVFAAIEKDRDNASLQAYSLLSTLTGDFEACRSVIQHLSPESPEALMTASVSSAIADSLYSAFLEKSINSDSMTIDDLKRQEELSIISENGRELLMEATARLEETRKQRDELASKRKDILDEKIKSLSASFEEKAINVGKFRTEKGSGDLEKVSALIGEAESRRKTYAALQDDLFSKLNKILKLRYEQIEKAKEEIMNAPYESIDYVDGKVSKEAEEWREKKLRSTKERISAEFSGSGTELVEKYMKELESAEKATVKIINQLSNKMWTLSSSSPGFTFTVLRPDLEKGIIVCSCSVIIANSVIETEIAPDYSSITGKRQPSMTSVLEYEEYRSEMGVWYELFTEYPELFDIEIDVKIRANGTDYVFDILSCRIKRKDNGKYIYRAYELNENRSVKYSTPVRVDDYSWVLSYSLIVDTEKFVNESGIKGKRLSYVPSVDEGYKEPRKNLFKNSLILETGLAPLSFLNGKGQSIRLETSVLTFAGRSLITGFTCGPEFLSTSESDNLVISTPILLNFGYYYPATSKNGFYIMASGGPCIISNAAGDKDLHGIGSSSKDTREFTFAGALETGFVFMSKINDSILSHRIGIFSYMNIKHGTAIGVAYRLGFLSLVF